MFGSHLSIAGGMHNALIQARELDFDCVQVFTKNQRQWNAPPLSEEQVKLWHEHQKTTGIGPAVSHDSYLINLASPDADNHRKSLDLYIDELQRCEMLNIPFLVIHPGAHVGQGEEKGLKRIAKSIDSAHQSTRGFKTLTCLEITAGQGTTLGCTFEHLRTIIDAVKESERLALCIDTAHALAAGYDLTSESGTKKTLQQLDNVLGLECVKVLHLNDSKTPRGSRVDRHEHIGHGHISLDAFKVIVNHPAFAAVPKILETPKAESPEGLPWDTINLKTLHSLQKKNQRKTKSRPAK